MTRSHSPTFIQTFSILVLLFTVTSASRWLSVVGASASGAETLNKSVVQSMSVRAVFASSRLSRSSLLRYHGGVSACAVFSACGGLGIGHSGDAGELGVTRTTGASREKSNPVRLRAPAQNVFAFEESMTLPVNFNALGGGTKLTVFD